MYDRNKYDDNKKLISFFLIIIYIYILAGFINDHRNILSFWQSKHRKNAIFFSFYKNLSLSIAKQMFTNHIEIGNQGEN